MVKLGENIHFGEGDNLVIINASEVTAWDVVEGKNRNLTFMDSDTGEFIPEEHLNVKFAFSAPRHIPIVREELLNR